MVIELPACRGMFRKSVLGFFASESYFICTNRMCHDNCYVFCSFFIRYRHAPSPSRVGTNEGLLRPHFPYSMSSKCLKNLIFENFIHYLHKKLFWNKERSNSTRIWPCSEYFCPTGCSRCRLTLHSRRGQAMAAACHVVVAHPGC